MPSQTRKHFLSSNGMSSHTMLFHFPLAIASIACNLGWTLPSCVLYKSARHHSHSIAYWWHCCNLVSEFWISSLSSRLMWSKTRAFQTPLSSRRSLSAANSASCYPIKLYFSFAPAYFSFLIFKWNCSGPHYSHASKSAPLTVFPVIQTASLFC